MSNTESPFAMEVVTCAGANPARAQTLKLFFERQLLLLHNEQAGEVNETLLNGVREVIGAMQLLVMKSIFSRVGLKLTTPEVWSWEVTVSQHGAVHIVETKPEVKLDPRTPAGCVVPDWVNDLPQKKKEPPPDPRTSAGCVVPDWVQALVE